MLVKLEGLGEPVIIIDPIKAAVSDAEIVEHITARKVRAASIRLEESYQFLYVMSRLYEPPDASNTNTNTRDTRYKRLLPMMILIIILLSWMMVKILLINQCLECDKSFMTRQHLKEHNKVHSTCSSVIIVGIWLRTRKLLIWTLEIRSFLRNFLPSSGDKC